jgi:hypothetical protein
VPATDSGASTTSRLTSVWIATVGALDAFVRGSERRIDLAGVDGRVFVNNASLGAYAKTVQSADYRDATAETVARMVPDPYRPLSPGTNGTRDALDTHVLSIIAVRAVKPRELVTLLPPEPPAQALGAGVARLLGAGVHGRRRRASRLPSMASPPSSIRRSSSRRFQRRCVCGAGPPTCFASAKTTLPARSTEGLVPFPAAERAS